MFTFERNFIDIWSLDFHILVFRCVKMVKNLQEIKQQRLAHKFTLEWLDIQDLLYRKVSPFDILKARPLFWWNSIIINQRKFTFWVSLSGPEVRINPFASFFLLFFYCVQYSLQILRSLHDSFTLFIFQEGITNNSLTLGQLFLKLGFQVLESLGQ